MNWKYWRSFIVIIYKDEAGGYVKCNILSLFGFHSEDRSHACVHSPGREEPCTAAQLSTRLSQVSIYTAVNDKARIDSPAAQMTVLFLRSRYLVKNSASLFNASDYEVAPPEYHRKAV